MENKWKMIKTRKELLDYWNGLSENEKMKQISTSGLYGYKKP